MQDMLATVVLTMEDIYVGAMELAAQRSVIVLSIELCCTIFNSAVQNLLCNKVGYCARQHRTAQHCIALSLTAQSPKPAHLFHQGALMQKGNPSRRSSQER
jgi:hypothetical protein